MPKSDDEHLIYGRPKKFVRLTMIFKDFTGEHSHHA